MEGWKGGTAGGLEGSEAEGWEEGMVGWCPLVRTSLSDCVILTGYLTGLIDRPTRLSTAWVSITNTATNTDSLLKKEKHQFVCLSFRT